MLNVNCKTFGSSEALVLVVLSRRSSIACGAFV